MDIKNRGFWPSHRANTEAELKKIAGGRGKTSRLAERLRKLNEDPQGDTIVFHSARHLRRAARARYRAVEKATRADSRDEIQAGYLLSARDVFANAQARNLEAQLQSLTEEDARRILAENPLPA